MVVSSEELYVVGGQRWDELPAPALGTWRPQRRVDVVIPARDCQLELDRTLAALAHQTYPADLMGVVVVDDASSPPLTLPALCPPHTRIQRLDERQEHGSGRARDAGARASTAELLLFLDADMIPDRAHVEAHARWHHTASYVVSLGYKRFVDVDDLSAEAVARAASDGSLRELLGSRPSSRHAWQEDLIDGQDRLTQDSEDAFVTVVGASVGLHRDLYVRAGGFSSYGLRGIVDTEFGYRAFTAGGLIVPDEEALAWHQGRRNFERRGDEIKRQRTGLAANRLPHPLFRPANAGRRWAVPMVRVVVDGRGLGPEQAQVSVDSVLASSITDLVVTLVADEEVAAPWLHDYFAADCRVEWADTPPGTGFPSPYTAALPASLSVQPQTLARVLQTLRQPGVGMVRCEPSGSHGATLDVAKTRALERAKHVHPTDLDSALARGWDIRWHTADEIGVVVTQYRVTKQGMILSAHRASGACATQGTSRSV
jgi:GT2 family glycosyltransferase